MSNIKKFAEFVNENLNEESFADFNKSSGFKMDSKAKSTLKKLNVNPTKLKDAFDDYSKIMKYIDSNGKKIGTVSIPNPGSKSNPEFMYTVYDTDMYGKVLTGDGDSVFIEMVKESLNEKFTFADAVETAGDDVKKNEKGIASALKALKAKSGSDIMIMTDTTEDDGLFDAIKGMKELPVNSTIYDKAYVGKYKGKDVVVFDGGEDLFAYTK